MTERHERIVNDQRSDEQARVAKRDAAAAKAELENQRGWWIANAVPKCIAEWSDKACAEPSDVPTDEDRDRCRLQCKDAIRSDVENTYQEALNECVGSFVDHDGNWKPACNFRVQAGATDLISEHSKECSQSCGIQGKTQLRNERDRREMERHATHVIVER
jgi:hypothetical protein